MSKPTDTVDEILNYYGMNCAYEAMGETPGDLELLTKGQARTALNKAYLQEFLDLIGEDDDVHSPINPESDEDLLITLGENANNRLRATLRAAAIKQFGGDEK